MALLAQLGTTLGISLTSGINLYLTIAALGIAGRMEWILLPGDLQILMHPVIIITALIIYLVEFLADKVPYVDSAWDSVHTFIRPVGGFILAYMASAEMAPVAQAAVGLVGGSVALDSHLAKAGSRVMINASPEPVTNSVASVSEDVTVIGVLWLVISHPVIAAILVSLFVLFSFWFIPKLFGLLKKAFGFLFNRGKPKSSNPN